MMQTAVGLAGFLVLLIVAAGASCWTIAMLKLLATSRQVPESLARAAAQLLATLGYQPDEPLIPWSPRRGVPWGLVDLIGVIAVLLLIMPTLVALLKKLHWLPEGDDAIKLALSDKQWLVWIDSLAKVCLVLVAFPLIALRSGANWRDFGFSIRDLWSDVKLGLAGFVMLAPPVYALQGLLVYLWKPSKHPLMEMFKETPDVSFFAVLFVAAAVVAPLFEELVFRVLLQGFLENVFAIGRPAYELLFGSPRYAADSRPALATQPDTAAHQNTAEIVFISDRPLADTNPYSPSAIVGEGAVAAALVDDSNLGELRGTSAWLPIAISSLIFALLHYTHGPDWVPLLILAAGMGFLYQRTHRLVPSLIVHTLLNSLSMFGLWLQVYALPEQGLGN